MRSRSLSVIFLGMTLILFLASQALAQRPITGWDKARFGMSPEELREAYKEEEEDYKDWYHQTINWIKEHYADEPQKLEEQMSLLRKYSSEEFWMQFDSPFLVSDEYREITTLSMVTLEGVGAGIIPVSPSLKKRRTISHFSCFSFGEMGLHEVYINIVASEVFAMERREFFNEPKRDYEVEVAEEASEDMNEEVRRLFIFLEEFGEGKFNKEEKHWIYEDLDGNKITFDPTVYKISHNNKDYFLTAGFGIKSSGVRGAATITALRRYVDKPYKSPGDLSHKAWEKFTTEAWGTPHPATAEEMAEARLQGEPLPPVPHKYNDWKERMETIDYNQVPDFDKPLAAFLTMGGRTIRSFGSPTDVERMMDMPAIRANKCLQTILGLTEDFESWNATSFKNRSFWAKFAAYLELTKSVVTSDKLKDFLFKEWLYGDLQSESETG